MTQIRLTQDAYSAGGTYRLPTEDGQPSIYIMGPNWYEAPAEDADGNDYMVYWNILPSYNPADGDESYACDWDSPSAVVRDDYRLITDYILKK